MNLVDLKEISLSLAKANFITPGGKHVNAAQYYVAMCHTFSNAQSHPQILPASALDTSISSSLRQETSAGPISRLATF